MDIKLEKVECFVKNLLQKLPDGMFFHDFDHTLNVVKGVQVIGRNSGCSDDEIYILTIAAFLHDIGYVQLYLNHEQQSADMAKLFLTEIGLGKKAIDLVTQCILATRFPQHAKDKMQQIMCDADLYHFSFKDYIGYAEKLKREWEIHLGRYYSDKEWNVLNLGLLRTHVYFTAYGQDILEQKKKANIERLVLLLQ